MIIETLELFLKQAKTKDLTTKGYISSYNDCKVKVSFGKGRISNVPWIAFINRYNEIRSGIYPILLYYKKINTIVVAFGIGSYYETSKEWNIDESFKLKTIKSELGKKYEGIIPYAKSYAYSHYLVDDQLKLINLIDDIDFVIDLYKKDNAK